MTDETPNPRIVELEDRLAEMETRTTQRLVQGELKSHALRAGLIDLDALKLLDVASLKLDDMGNLQDASGIMADLKRNKPYLFPTLNTSYPAAAPPTTTPFVKKATEMTHTEWQAARSEILKRR